MESVMATDQFEVSTKGATDVVDVTAEVAQIVRTRGLVEGHVLVFVPGSTAALTTVEFEPGLGRDLPEAFERLVPSDRAYHHDRTWHDGNGHSHVRASLVGPSLTIPVKRASLLLGTWQQIVLLDFDNRPRRREVIVQVAGRGVGGPEGHAA